MKSNGQARFEAKNLSYCLEKILVLTKKHALNSEYHCEECNDLALSRDWNIPRTQNKLLALPVPLEKMNLVKLDTPSSFILSSKNLLLPLSFPLITLRI
jgi:hypothetical protein